MVWWAGRRLVLGCRGWCGGLVDAWFLGVGGWCGGLVDAWFLGFGGWCGGLIDEGTQGGVEVERRAGFLRYHQIEAEPAEHSEHEPEFDGLLAVLDLGQPFARHAHLCGESRLGHLSVPPFGADGVADIRRVAQPDPLDPSLVLSHTQSYHRAVTRLVVSPCGYAAGCVTVRLPAQSDGHIYALAWLRPERSAFALS